MMARTTVHTQRRNAPACETWGKPSGRGHGHVGGLAGVTLLGASCDGR